MNEHDGEAIRGIPGVLPPGERVLWQGSPNWRVLAWRALLVGPVLCYFAVLAVWRIVQSVLVGDGLLSGLGWALGLMPGAVMATAILCGIAYWLARRTIYSITTRRVVIRFGVAFQMAVNLPFAEIGGARLKVHGDGSGDLPLVMTGRGRIAWLHLWPNVRPWRMTQVEPMLRAVENPEDVSRILSDALTAYHAEHATDRVAVPAAGDRTTDGRKAPAPEGAEPAFG